MISLITNSTTGPFSLRCVFNTALCDKVCQGIETGLWGFFLGTPVSSTSKTYRHNIADILLKLALNTITLNHSMVLNVK